MRHFGLRKKITVRPQGVTTVVSLCVVVVMVSAGSDGGAWGRGVQGRMGARVSLQWRGWEVGVIEAKSGVYATSIAQSGPADGATGLPSVS